MSKVTSVTAAEFDRLVEVSDDPRIEAARERLEKKNQWLLETDRRARYKIEVIFSGDLSIHRPRLGILMFWESGAALHGGGDRGLYLCPSESRGYGPCAGILPNNVHGPGFFVCPKCKQRWRETEVEGQIFQRVSIQAWAETLVKYFHRLEGDCDLYMKWIPGSIIAASEIEQQKQKGGELLGAVQGKKTTVLYPLKNILVDTSAGSSLYDRFSFFLKVI